MLYSDTSLLRQLPAANLVQMLTMADEKFGKTQNIMIHGFRFQEVKGRIYLYFSASLLRVNASQAVDVFMDPATAKVMSVDL